MAAKQSNPGSTALILLSIILVLIIVFQGFMMVLAISVYKVADEEIDPDDEEEVESAFEAAEDAAFAFCGMCIFWPIIMAYIATAFSISLVGRDVYGNKHALSTLIGFFLGIGGVITALAGSFMFLIILSPEVGIPFSLTLPVIMVAVGLFLFIKDVGGKLWGAIGMGTTIFSQVFLMISLTITLQADNPEEVKTPLIMAIVAIAICVIGLILMIVGFIQSYIWMKKNKPLIDEEQEKQLKMQQQQLSIQQQQLALQKQQLELQVEQQRFLEMKSKKKIPGKSSSVQENIEDDDEEWD